MSTQHLRNIGLEDYREYLNHIGCKSTRKKGGHEHYTRHDLLRPLTLQSHISPVDGNKFRKSLFLIIHD